MPEEKMSKKLRQAVQHANETNPTTKTNNTPSTSKKKKVQG